MKTALAFASLLAITASAFATEPYPKARFDDAPSTLTRAQVQAEVEAARARGDLDEAAKYNLRARADASQGTQKTRAQVQAELQAARDSGQWRAGLESVYGGVSPYAAAARAAEQGSTSVAEGQPGPAVR